MKVSLVSPYPDIANYGLRTLSAVLREAGHDTTFICMPDFAGDGESAHTKMSEARYTDTAIDQMIETMRGSELVGITLMTHYFDSAKQITRAVHERLGIPVIWGGFHPSVRPDECIHHCDYVAVGDSEDLILQLVEQLEEQQEELELRYYKHLNNLYLDTKIQMNNQNFLNKSPVDASYHNNIHKDYYNHYNLQKPQYQVLMKF